MALAVPTTTKQRGSTISYVDDAGALRIIAFDATLRDTHAGAATATEHALDVNAKITNHVRAEARRLTLEVEVTNTPLIPIEGSGSTDLQINRTFKDFTAAQATVTQGVFLPGLGTVPSPIVSFTPGTQTDRSNPTKARVTTYSGGLNRVREVYTALDSLRESGTAVQVVTRLRTYSEMVITNVGTPHGPEDSVTFTVDLVEIRRASSEVVQVEPLVSEKRAEKKQGTGSQPKYEPPAAQKESLAAKLAGIDSKALGL
jgi:hypothetical protein